MWRLSMRCRDVRSSRNKPGVSAVAQRRTDGLVEARLDCSEVGLHVRCVGEGGGQCVRRRAQPVARGQQGVPCRHEGGARQRAPAPDESREEKTGSVRVRRAAPPCYGVLHSCGNAVFQALIPLRCGREGGDKRVGGGWVHWGEGRGDVRCKRLEMTDGVEMKKERRYRLRRTSSLVCMWMETSGNWARRVVAMRSDEDWNWNEWNCRDEMVGRARMLCAGRQARLGRRQRLASARRELRPAGWRQAWIQSLGLRSLC
ncbi:hypothetical protein CC85DRAFT_35122 [Cutaneotrichosporon oleaginosum]|uniref:Uncharacterized protein n=1 Tax=Cutaneotrichosporon oleaginosum TaxID=879819 RepID=A0A0J1B831_9TREE|nr:uncharacterized protein CC85DRAFT_35122 [Cutaneotrichosporon oleaginosum]KLT43924.1 hypothetical protein CC85DRAFT_35122 [Cutaneotrichosporon oleaginosum]TXT04129.1 hypothetical protein COLE_07826 [Cutaneotrichosporon oleaginosum]